MISPSALGFFDSLVHVTDDGSWLGARRFDASEARLMAAIGQVAPARACLVAIAGWNDNDTVLRVASANPSMFVPIAGVDPTELAVDDDLTGKMACLMSRGFSGIKLHPRLNQYDPLDERCVAVIEAAGNVGLVVFIDTLFRQPARPTRHAVDIVDAIANRCRSTSIVLLHGTGPTLLELFELGRMHSHLLLDLSFTLMRYANSSIDSDIRFVCEQLDQRVILGSDFPEYLPVDVLARFNHINRDLSGDKRDNILFRNLQQLFPLPVELRCAQPNAVLS